MVNYSYKKHYKVKHGENEFVDGQNHINDIENFCGHYKVRLAKFRGMNKNAFYLHIKERETTFSVTNSDTILETKIFA